MKKEDHIKNFSNPCWVSYLSPYTLIVPDGEEPLRVELDDINANTYNHGKLCSIVSSNSIESFHYDLMICYDGAMAVAKYGKFAHKESAVDFFNSLFCKLLLGGVFSEAIDRRDIVNGSIHERRAIWPVDFGNSASTYMHSRLRMRVGNNMDSISLVEPNYITLSEFKSALTFGDSITSQIKNLTPKFLLRGITEIMYKNWDLVLSNLWISVEQLTDFIWNNLYLANPKYHPSTDIAGRKSSMKDDNRTWSTSVKQELLYQNSILTEEIISKLHPARKARNKLVHEGKSVPKSVALDLYVGVKLLLEKASGNDNLELIDISERPDSWDRETSNFEVEYFRNWGVDKK